MFMLLYASVLIRCFKAPLMCLETCSIIQCVDVISTERGRQGRTYRTAPSLF